MNKYFILSALLITESFAFTYQIWTNDNKTIDVNNTEKIALLKPINDDFKIIEPTIKDIEELTPPKVVNDSLRNCIMIYEPVCGYDTETENLKTFSNTCMMNNSDKYSFLHYGECITDNLQKLRAKPENYI